MRVMRKRLNAGGKVGASARPSVLRHALEFLRKLGDFLHFQRELTTQAGSEKRRQPWSSAQESSEAVARQPPEHGWRERYKRRRADFVAHQAQVAEDSRRMEHFQPDAAGLAFDHAVAEDVQRIGAGALGEDDFAGVERYLFERGRQTGAVDGR